MLGRRTVYAELSPPLRIECEFSVRFVDIKFSRKTQKGSLAKFVLDVFAKFSQLVQFNRVALPIWFAAFVYFPLFYSRKVLDYISLIQCLFLQICR